MSIKITLPSKEEVEGKSKVFEKVGAGCGHNYWTSTLSRFASWHSASEFHVYPLGEFDSWDVQRGLGVRPVMKSDNLNELIKGCKSYMDNGIQVIEYGKFPHMLETVKIDDTSVLKETGREYILPKGNNFTMALERLTEYDYNGQKVVYLGKYHPIKPAEWYNDEENNMLISKAVLFESPINVDNPNYDGSFETSELYGYLNNEFIKQLIPFMKQFNQKGGEIPNPYGLDLEMVD